MAQVVLHESGGSLRAAAEGAKWQATLLTPGTGSSGTYSDALLEEYGPRAFKAGLKLWWGHPKENEGPGDRDARDQWGVLDENAEYVPGEGLVGKIRLLPHWKDVVESLGDQASLSIYAMGEADKDGNVTSFVESDVTSVDIVSYPGRPGSGLKAKLEAARAASKTPGVTSASKGKEESMDKAEVEGILDAKLAPVIASVNEALANKATEAQAKVDAEALSTAVKEAVSKFRASIERIDTAELLAPIAEGLIARAADGEEITDAVIATAKEDSGKLLDAAKVVLGEKHSDAGDRFGIHTSTDSGANFRVAGWSN